MKFFTIMKSWAPTAHCLLPFRPCLARKRLQFVGSMRARKKNPWPMKSWLFNDGILMSWFVKWPPYNWVVLHPQFQERVLCQLNHRPSKTRSTQCLRLYFCQLGQQKLQFFWQRLAEKSFKLYHIFINLVVEPSLSFEQYANVKLDHIHTGWSFTTWLCIQSSDFRWGFFLAIPKVKCWDSAILWCQETMKLRF